MLFTELEDLVVEKWAVVLSAHGHNLDVLKPTVLQFFQIADIVVQKRKFKVGKKHEKRSSLTTSPLAIKQHNSYPMYMCISHQQWFCNNQNPLC